MQRFELNDGTSSKFWEIERQGCDLNVRFGKIGTAGQNQTKNHPDEAKATVALAKLIKEKTGKGYVETAGAETPTPAAATVAAPRAKPTVANASAPASAPVPAPPSKPTAANAAPASDAAPVTLEGVTPWEADGPLLDVAPRLAELALPSRRRPGVAPSSDIDECWNRFIKFARDDRAIVIDQCSDVYKAPFTEAVERIAKGNREGSMESDVMLLVVEMKSGSYQGCSDGTPFVDFLVASKGLPYALEILFKMQHGTHHWVHCERLGRYGINFVEGSDREYDGSMFSDTELGLRAHLAVADAVLYEQCVRIIRSAVPSLPESRRPLCALLLPDLPEFSNELAMAGDIRNRSMAWLLLTATSAEAMKRLRSLKPGAHYNQLFYDSDVLAMTAVMDRGVLAAEILRDGAWHDESSQAPACINTPAAMLALARACDHDKDTNERSRLLFADMVRQRPLACLAALSELVTMDGQGPLWAHAVLIRLVYTHLDKIAAIRPLVSKKAAQTLDAVLARYAAPGEIAEAAELPPVLATPPWSRPAKKSGAALALEPLPLAPVERWDEEDRKAMLATFTNRGRYPVERLMADPS